MIEEWNNKRIKEIQEHILNWHLDSAEVYLQENEVDYRVVQEDGKNYMITCDLNLNRLNLYVEEGFITKINVG